MRVPKLSLAPLLWPARDYHREAFNDYAESEFSKLARRVAWAQGDRDGDGPSTERCSHPPIRSALP